MRQQLKFSTTCARLARPSPRPKEDAPSLFARFKKYQENPRNRRKIAVAWIAFYALTGLAAIQYLKDTKYKALGSENPYNKAADAPKAGIVEAHDTTPVYDEIAKDYDSKIWLEELTSYIWWMRRRLMRHVHGDALEVSCGTGRNLAYFKPKQVRSLTLLDSSEPMLREAEAKFDKKFPDYEHVQFVKGRAEDLVQLSAKSGQKFDTIYESFGLCSHEDPAAALANMQRLLRPRGEIVLLEHGRGPYESMNKRMDEKAEERAKEWGCRWNLDIDKIVRSSGLEIVEEGRYHFGTIYFYVLKQPPTRDP